MRKLFLPLMLDEHTYLENRNGFWVLPGSESWPAFSDMEKARAHAKDLSLKNPKGTVVVFEAMAVISPRKVEFAEKTYNTNGELIA